MEARSCRSETQFTVLCDCYELVHDVFKSITKLRVEQPTSVQVHDPVLLGQVGAEQHAAREAAQLRVRGQGGHALARVVDAFGLGEGGR